MKMFQMSVSPRYSFALRGELQVFRYRLRPAQRQSRSAGRWLLGVCENRGGPHRQHQAHHLKIIRAALRGAAHQNNPGTGPLWLHFIIEPLSQLSIIYCMSYQDSFNLVDDARPKNLWLKRGFKASFYYLPPYDPHRIRTFNSLGDEKSLAPS